MKTIILSDDAYAMVCGLVAPSDDADSKRGVNHAGVFGPIEEVQANFPVTDFWAAIEGKTEDDDFYYDSEAGF